MKSVWMKIVIGGLCLLLVGAGFAGVGLILGGSPSFAFSLHDKKIITDKNIKLIQKEQSLEGYTKITLDVENADVKIQEGEEYKISYSLYVDPTIKTVEDSFTIKNYSKNVNINFGWNTKDSEEIVITVPKNKQDMELKLNMDCGDVKVEGVICSSANYDMEYGNLKMEDCKVDKVKTSMNSGDCNIKNCEMNEFESDMEYGEANIKDSKVNVVTMNGDSGDISLDLIGTLADYSIALSSDCGDISVNGKEQSQSMNTQGSNPDKKIKVDCEYGDINIDVK